MKSVKINPELLGEKERIFMGFELWQLFDLLLGFLFSLCMVVLLPDFGMLKGIITALPALSFVIINHVTGIPYGVHEDTKQEMLIDRRLLLNGNEWGLGVPGSGKSMRVKITAILEALLTPGDVIFVDPHGEYTNVTRALGGQVITLGTGSNDVINAMDMCQGDGVNPYEMLSEDI